MYFQADVVAWVVEEKGNSDLDEHDIIMKARGADITWYLMLTFLTYPVDEKFLNEDFLIPVLADFFVKKKWKIFLTLFGLYASRNSLYAVMRAGNLILLMFNAQVSRELSRLMGRFAGVNAWTHTESPCLLDPNFSYYMNFLMQAVDRDTFLARLTLAYATSCLADANSSWAKKCVRSCLTSEYHDDDGDLQPLFVSLQRELDTGKLKRLSLLFPQTWREYISMSSKLPLWTCFWKTGGKLTIQPATLAEIPNVVFVNQSLLLYLKGRSSPQDTRNWDRTLYTETVWDPRDAKWSRRATEVWRVKDDEDIPLEKETNCVMSKSNADVLGSIGKMLETLPERQKRVARTPARATKVVRTKKVARETKVARTLAPSVVRNRARTRQVMARFDVGVGKRKIIRLKNGEKEMLEEIIKSLGQSLDSNGEVCIVHTTRRSGTLTGVVVRMLEDNKFVRITTRFTPEMKAIRQLEQLGEKWDKVETLSETGEAGAYTWLWPSRASCARGNRERLFQSPGSLKSWKTHLTRDPELVTGLAAVLILAYWALGLRRATRDNVLVIPNANQSGHWEAHLVLMEASGVQPAWPDRPKPIWWYLQESVFASLNDVVKQAKENKLERKLYNALEKFTNIPEATSVRSFLKDKKIKWSFGPPSNTRGERKVGSTVCSVGPREKTQGSQKGLAPGTHEWADQCAGRSERKSPGAISQVDKNLTKFTVCSKGVGQKTRGKQKVFAPGTREWEKACAEKSKPKTKPKPKTKKSRSKTTQGPQRGPAPGAGQIRMVTKLVRSKKK